MNETTEPVTPAPAKLRVLAPLGIRDFALLWSGTTMSLVGDGLYFVAIAWQVYEISNVPTALSIVGVAWSAPMVLLLLGGGVAADRFDRRNILILADLARALALGAIGMLSVLGVLELWHVVALVVLFGVGESFTGPAFGAIVPDVVPERLLVEANSLNQFVEPIGWRMAGPALAGWAIHAFGTGETFLLGAAIFFAAGVLISLMRSTGPVEREDGSSIRREIAEGFQFVRARVWLWGTLIGAALGLFLFIGPYEVLVPYVVKNELGGGADDLGLVFVSGGIGALLAALVLGQRGLPRRQVTFMYLAWTVSILAIAGYGLASELWHAMVASFVSGAGFAGGQIVWATLMQKLVPTELLGRVTSFDWFIAISLLPVSYALTGPTAAALGTQETLVWAGVLGGALTFAFLFLPGMRDVEREAASDPSAA